MRNSTVNKEMKKITTDLYRGKRRTKNAGHIFMSSWEAEEDYETTIASLKNEIDNLGYVKRLW